jgi:hypothetical protein
LAAAYSKGFPAIKALFAGCQSPNGASGGIYALPNAGGSVRKITFAGYRIRLPHHPVIRMMLGIVLVVLGIFGFLPILGFWMIPLGLVILSIDVPMIRRQRRKWTVRIGIWLKERHPKFARAIGFAVRED